MKKICLNIILLTTLIAFLTSCSGLTDDTAIVETEQAAQLLSETPIPTPVPTATLIPTPLPEVRLQTAEDYMLAGDFDSAKNEFITANSSLAKSDYRLTSAMGLGSIYYHEGNFDLCISTLNQELDRTEPLPDTAPLWYQLAKCYDSNGEISAEIEALKQYQQLFPETNLAGQTYEQIGDLYYSLSDYDSARSNYQSALDDENTSDRTGIWMKIADCYNSAGDDTNTIKTWLDTFEMTDNETWLSRINYYLGTKYLEMGENLQAYSRFQDSVNNYPRVYESYLCLVELLNHNQNVDAYQRGLINYYQGNYALSMESFHSYMKLEADHDGSAYYYIGVGQMYLGDYDEAISTFRILTSNYPNNRFYTNAWDEIAYIQWNFQEKFLTASRTLREFVSLHPDRPDAAVFLYEAGSILERGNHLSQAAEVWSRLIDEYPLYEQSSLALFQAALCNYRLTNYENALTLLNRLVLVSGIPDELARAHFWLGKTWQQKGENDQAETYFKQAIDEAPISYYGFRAQEVLSGNDPLEFSDRYDLQFNLDQERGVAEQWMRIEFNIDQNIDITSPDILLIDKDYQTANEYWRLGEYQNALDSFETVRIRYENDPVTSFRLLVRLTDLGAWRVAVFTSRQILTSAGLIEDVRTLSAPNYFNHIRYGTHYLTYVLDASETYGIHPFILYALMRQESMFDPWIESSAGAQGLMQIMPATGKEISDLLRWPKDYTQSDLLRASVAIPLSGSYLSRMNTYFSSDNFGMLASYNAGAGNTTIWMRSAENDPDIFAEIIRFEETRNYIQNVYIFAHMYEHIYGME